MWKRPRLTIEQRAARVDRLEWWADHKPLLSDEQRDTARGLARKLRIVNLEQAKREAKEAEASRARLCAQLSHDHMILMAETMVGWALSHPEGVERWLVMSDQLRDLADEVGPDWNPSEPERLSAMGFLARRMAEPR